MAIILPYWAGSCVTWTSTIQSENERESVPIEKMSLTFSTVSAQPLYDTSYKLFKGLQN